MKTLTTTEAMSVNGGKSYYCSVHKKTYSSYASLFSHVLISHVKDWGPIFLRLGKEAIPLLKKYIW